MPLIKDMTKIYVGATPIEKVYAGTDLVWHSDEGFELTQYIDKRGLVAAGFDAWCFEWQYNFDPFTCDEAGRLFSIRAETAPYGSGAWTEWQPFNNLDLTSSEAFTTCATWLYQPENRLIFSYFATNSLIMDIGRKWQVRLVQNGKTTIAELTKRDIRPDGQPAPNAWWQTQCSGYVFP